MKNREVTIKIHTGTFDEDFAKPHPVPRTEVQWELLFDGLGLIKSERIEAMGKILAYQKADINSP